MLVQFVDLIQKSPDRCPEPERHEKKGPYEDL